MPSLATTTQREMRTTNSMMRDKYLTSCRKNAAQLVAKSDY